MSDFKNPYAGVKETKKVFIIMSTDDYNLLKCTRPPMGTLSTTVGILVNKLCNALRSHGITDVSKLREFETFVSDCTIESPSTDCGGLPFGPTGSPSRETV